MKRRALSVLAAVATASVLAGCGTRLTHAEIVEDARVSSVAPNDRGQRDAGEGAGTGAAEGAAAPAEAAPAGAVAGESQPAASGASPGSVSPSGNGATGAAAGPSAARAAASPNPNASKGSTSAGGNAKSTAASPNNAAAGPKGSGNAAPLPASPGGKCSQGASTVSIGSVGNQSGPAGAAIFPGYIGVRTWVAWINAQGGLNCHPVKYIAADDGGDPARHLSLVKQQVESDKVLAFVYMGAPLSGQASVDYLNQKRVPAIGSEGGSSWFNTSSMHFPQGPSGNPPGTDLTLLAGSAVYVPKGVKKIATITCQEVAFCNEGGNHFPEAASKFGFQVVFQGKATLTQPDFSSQCLGAQANGAQAIAVIMDGQSIKRIARSCNSVGLKVPIFMYAVQSTGDMNKEPVLEGSIIANPWAPWFGSAPPVLEYQDALKKYAPGTSTDTGTIGGWTSAKVFERALVGHSNPNPTSEDVLRGLWSFKGENLGGLAIPLTYAEGKPVPPSAVCGWVIKIEGGKFTSDEKLACAK